MYQIRTDLAIENREIYKNERNKDSRGINVEKEENESYIVTRIKVLNKEGSENLNRPIGNYITIDVPKLNKSDEDLKDEISQVVAKEIKGLGKNKEDSKILIVGLGNWNITPDALGPKVVERVLVTRQFFVNYNKEIDETVANVAALSPGVMGITGIETGEIIKGVVEKVKPDLVIAVDALASRKMDRVSTTIQISDTGINPGSGVGNNRMEFNENTLGVPVIAIGIPTVVDAATIVNDTLDLVIDSLKSESKEGSDFYNLLSKVSSEEKYSLIQDVLNPYMKNVVVTPTDIDALVDDLSIIVANGLNIALHPGIDLKDVNRYIR
ncbi:spore protease [Tissierella praeacuta DSM 18095]|uniref:Spore protease n=1 Tax=Tissierella praeacuta DSM 18095 TaxID=1123404 RepID=A0A1M4S809_9FIRM|nr:GPR endopeptidase [Tissierella praeacuta]TCU71704.1 spore protease [Tissierella praeacuta]SHE28339.1 spore protease [Tissierella praeacuta DSM 18095]SUP01084.1 Germination protease precursor [Tissierella praeacuta]